MAEQVPGAKQEHGAKGADAPAADPVPRVLEIRVHGIANAPPATMLEVEPSQVRRSYGDDLGSFWVRSSDAPDATTGITSTEAYSWGAMARSGGSALAVIGRVFVHLGWLFILPFGLCNLAYWVRPIPAQDTASPDSWRGGPGAATLRVFALVLTLIYVAAFMSVSVDLVAVQCFAGGGVCAALPSFLDGLRGFDRDARSAVFSLGPVLAMLVIYLIARGGRVNWEPNINAFATKFLGSGAAAQGGGGDGGAESVAEEAVGRPLLATTGFWTRARTGPTSERLHFAAVLALVLLLLGWDTAFSRQAEECAVVGTFGPDCVADAWAAGGTQAIALISVVVAAVTLGWAAVSVAAASQSAGAESDRRKRANAGWCLGIIAVAYVAHVVAALLTSSPPDASEPTTTFLGLVATPTVLLDLALGLAFLAAAWGTQANRTRSIVLMVIVGLAFALSVLVTNLASALVFLVVAVVVLSLHFFAIGVEESRPGTSRRRLVPRWYDLAVVGWRGLGAMVGMLAALLVTMMISSLLVLGMARWLGPAPEGKVEGFRRMPAEDVPDALLVPVAYGRFAVVLLAIVIAVLVLLAVSVAPKLAVLPRFTVPNEVPPDPERPPGERLGGETDPSPRYAGREPATADRRVRQVVIARRTAAILHRGEPLLGWIAGLSAIGFLTLASPTGYDWIADQLPPDWRAGIRTVSIGVLAFLALAAVAAVAAFAATKSDRPLALFWDVMCFFPRAGHPFAPPCYAERAVPELTARMRAWLTSEPDGGPATDAPASSQPPVDRATVAPADPPAERPGIIIAAHSMGSVVAAASIFALTDNTLMQDTPEIRRVALLTYGTQLRAFFSRFFPSVLGPADLGIPGLRGPSLFQRDPWTRQIRHEWPTAAAEPVQHEPAQAATPSAVPTPSQPRLRPQRIEFQHFREPRPFTLSGLLQGDAADDTRWISLWRRTDFLGFPVHSYNGDGNPLDRGASERAPSSYLWRVATHNDYLGTAQYLAARRDLVDRLRR